ncbi:type VII secretion integral membrane protein EccD [Mycobacterium sherrisii]|uniref:Type VII secretion integral membrane protein EccD n=1 Tax=Mycobacterium sherrisii TaxID=243061 RepID=A0A1E3SZS6_9MYCO|nr:type VII secretion integral membrane protein EccD [Mycobacterium sherrisii]MEC4764904.1 type VII secretion integral membrane protein EccD [Mycobacterium sherrisii]ODR07702.1 type VII secretion integral membrane protein EccD [Mycobacterium sherrisii]
MTLPSQASTLVSEPDDEQDLSRITVVVGGLLIDVGIPGTVSAAEVITDVIDLANERLAEHGDGAEEFENREGKWIFARLTGELLDPNRSLAAADVYDGELLLIREAGAREPLPLVDRLSGLPDSGDNVRCRLTEQLSAAGWSGWSVAGVALAVATAVMLRGRFLTPLVAGVPIAPAIALVAGFGCVLATGAMQLRSVDTRKCAWLTVVALPLTFCGSLHVATQAREIDALPAALALTALVALLQLLGSGRARPLFTAVTGFAVFGVPAAVAALVAGAHSRSVGAILATVAVIAVYLSPRSTIVLSRLPVPRVPTAGEPLDDIETQGGTAVEGVSAVGKQVIPTEQGMTDRVRRARDQLTGLVAAAGMLAIVGCYLVLGEDHEFYWQGSLFVAAVATVLCLRGRSHHDLAQSAVLIGGGLLIGLITIVKTATFVDGGRVNAAIALAVLTLLLLACGLIAPGREFSPVLRRQVEVIEYIAIALVFPLLCWIVGLYTFFRQLRI